MSTITWLIKRNDVNLFYLLNNKLSCRLLNIIMRLFTEIGSTSFAVFLSVSLIMFKNVLPKNTAFVLIMNLVVSQVVIQVLKRIVNRKRPYNTYEWVISKKPPKCQYSFPSGHTSSAFSIALTLSYFLPGFRLVFMPVAVVVGLSRVYLGCHYPTDVFIGALISYFVFIFTGFMIG